MKIRNVRVTVLRFVYPEDEAFHFAGGRCTGRLTCLVRVECDTGDVGLGSVYSHPDLVRAIIEDQLSDFLIGEDPLEVEKLWQRMYGVTRWYGRKGAAVSALGGIDMALWICAAKRKANPSIKCSERNGILFALMQADCFGSTIPGISVTKPSDISLTVFVP